MYRTGTTHKLFVYMARKRTYIHTYIHIYIYIHTYTYVHVNIYVKECTEQVLTSCLCIWPGNAHTYIYMCTCKYIRKEMYRAGTYKLFVYMARHPVCPAGMCKGSANGI